MDACWIVTKAFIGFDWVINFRHKNWQIQMEESSSDDCDVVVVGGGLSGLAAARTLIQHDSSLRVTLLEANDRLGGRVLSVNIEVDMNICKS